jgi:hypothetical protein
MHRDELDLLHRASAAEAEAAELQLAMAQLIGRGREIVEATQERQTEHKTYLEKAKEALAAYGVAAALSLERRIWSV